MVRAAVVQMDVALRQTKRNQQRILDLAAQTEADLVIFPECANSGYAFNSQDEAMPYAETIPGPFVEALTAVARDKSRCLAVGLLEKDGSRLRNSAVLVTAEGEVHVYRKTHLPYLGLDRFVTPGGSLPVFKTSLGVVGLLICYEWRFPEVARALALQGAELLIGLSNWPRGAVVIPTLLLPARAAENRVWIASANRVGLEGGSEFIGKSAVIDPNGDTVVALDGPQEGVSCCDMDLSLSRQKHLVRKPGEYEIDLFEDRRPALYGSIGLERQYD